MGLRLGNDVIQNHPAACCGKNIVKSLKHFAPERVQERSGETGKDDFDHARLSDRAPDGRTAVPKRFRRSTTPAAAAGSAPCSWF